MNIPPEKKTEVLSPDYNKMVTEMSKKDKDEIALKFVSGELIEKEPKREIAITPEERDLIIDQCISGLPNEKEYLILSGKMMVRFRHPTQNMLFISMRESEKELVSTDEMTRAGYNSLKAYNTMIAHVSSIGDKDFVIEQGDKYDTVEGFIARKKYMLTKLNRNVTDMVVDKAWDFMALMDAAYSNDSLKNT